MLTVAAALIERKGQIMIARRKETATHGHKWEFPGGKVEPNESPEECLRREMMEELGVEVKVGDIFCISIYDYPYFSIRLEVYRILAMSAEPVALEHDELRWVSPDEIGTFDFPEADRPLVAKLAARSATTRPIE